MPKTKQTQIRKISIAVLAFVLCAAVAVSLLISAPTANAYNADQNATVGEIFSNGTFDTSNMQVLLDKLVGGNSSGAMLEDVRNIGFGNSGTSVVKGNDSNAIIVTFGGIKWIAVYLSTARTDLTSESSSNTSMKSPNDGDIILTLWQAYATDTAVYNTYNTNSNTTYPANMYSTSQIRTQTLNNGGYYTSTGSNLNQVTQDSNSKYAKFTMSGATGSVTDYLVAPRYVSWQQSQTAANIQNNSNGNNWITYGFNNDAWGRMGVNNFYQQSADRCYEDKGHYTDWKDDLLWLPSIAETGFNGYTNGSVWQPTTSMLQNSNYAWLRSARTYYDTANVLNSSGGYNNGLVSATGYLVRPALHLNLTSAAQAAGLDKPHTEHTYGDTWYDDGNGYHYQKCTYAYCKDPIGNKAPHTVTSGVYSDANNHTGECSTCKLNVKMPHESDGKTYTDTTNHDDSGHWLKCKVCDDKYSQTTHNWDTLDTWHNKDDSTHYKQCPTCQQEKTAEHSPTTWSDAQDGQNHKSTCVCGKEILQQHTLGNWQVDAQNKLYQKCTVAGCNYETEHQEYGGTHEHKWSDDWYSNEGAHWKQCTECGAHQQDYSHTLDKWTVTSDGYHYQECSECNYKVRNEKHFLTKHDGYNPTCVDPGLKDYWECPVCSIYFSDDAGVKQIDLENWKNSSVDSEGGQIPATNTHTWGDAWYVDEEGNHFHKCLVCQTEGEKTSHNLSRVAEVPATCTTDGTKAYYICSDCSAIFSDSKGTSRIADLSEWLKKDGKIDSLGGEHDYDESGICRNCGSLDPKVKEDLQKKLEEAQKKIEEQIKELEDKKEEEGGTFQDPQDDERLKELEDALKRLQDALKDLENANPGNAGDVLDDVNGALGDAADATDNGELKNAKDDAHKKLDEEFEKAEKEIEEKVENGDITAEEGADLKKKLEDAKKKAEKDIDNATTTEEVEEVLDKVLGEDGEGGILGDIMDEAEQMHDWDDESWQYDATGHWHPCKDVGCTAKKGFVAHTMSEEIKIEDDMHYIECTDGCGYKHYLGTHGTTLNHDEGGHWYECTVCGRYNYTAHNWTDGEGSWTQEAEYHSKTCGVCSQEYKQAHSTSSWTNGDDNIHHKGECDVCGKEIEAVHSLGKLEQDDQGYYQKCTECDYKTQYQDIGSNHVHQWSQDLKSDDTNHWYECEDPECRARDQVKPHQFSDWTSEGESGHKRTCSDCEKEVTVEHTLSDWQVDGQGNHYKKCTVETCEYETEHSAHNMNKVAEVPATCEEDGTKAYYICSDCAGIFSDSKGTSKIENLGEWLQKDGKINNLGGSHDYDSETGLCKVCGALNPEVKEDLQKKLEEAQKKLEDQIKELEQKKEEGTDWTDEDDAKLKELEDALKRLQDALDALENANSGNAGEVLDDVNGALGDAADATDDGELKDAKDDALQEIEDAFNKAEEEIDQKVADGELTKEEGEELKKKLREAKKKAKKDVENATTPDEVDEVLDRVLGDNGEGGVLGDIMDEAEEMHDWDDKWYSNAAEHWHQCKDCGLRKDVGEHSFSKWSNAGSNHTRTCDGCDREEEAAHTLGSMKQGESGYYQECTADGCDYKVEYPDMGENHVHNYDQPYFDEGGHGLQCVCGARSEEYSFKHDYTDVTWKVADGKHSRKCTGCDYEFTDGHYAETISGKAATCKDDGLYDYYHCTVCDTYFSDSNCINKIADLKEWKDTEGKITAKDELHEFDEEKWVGDESGHWHVCKVCGAKQTSSEVTHIWSSVAWQQANGEHYQVCEVCGTEHGRGTHSITGTITSNGSETHNGVCETCGLTVSEAHNWNKDEWLKDENGHWHKCRDCSATTDYAAHVVNSWESNSTIHSSNCQICHEDITGEHVFESKSEGDKYWKVCKVCAYATEPSDHNINNWTKVDDEYHQGVCEDDDCDDKIQQQAHNWDNEHYVSDVTGHWIACVDCGAVKPGSFAAHTLTNAQSINSQTHTGTCSVCNETVTETHVMSEDWKTDGNAHWHECEACRHREDYSEHTVSNWETDGQQTHHGSCDDCGTLLEGKEHSWLFGTCRECGDKLTEYSDGDIGIAAVAIVAQIFALIAVAAIISRRMKR